MSKTIALTALVLSACTTTTEPNIGESVSSINPVSMCPASVPANLAPPAGQELKAAYAASGYQIYMCNGTTWAFQYPSANLLDQNGRVVGTHFKGPTWEFQDGSSVVGMKIQAATPDTTAIPWLLLKATSNTDSPDGDGRFADITYVQRLETTAGLAPKDACNSTNVGQLKGTPYTAVYFFYHLGDDDSRRCQ